MPVCETGEEGSCLAMFAHNGTHHVQRALLCSEHSQECPRDTDQGRQSAGGEHGAMTLCCKTTLCNLGKSAIGPWLGFTWFGGLMCVVELVCLVAVRRTDQDTQSLVWSDGTLFVVVLKRALLRVLDRRYLVLHASPRAKRGLHRSALTLWRWTCLPYVVAGFRGWRVTLRFCSAFFLCLAAMSGQTTLCHCTVLLGMISSEICLQASTGARSCRL